MLISIGFLSFGLLACSNKSKVSFYVEPLKEYIHDLLILNYGIEVAKNYVYKKYDFANVSGSWAWYSSPYTITTFTYETQDKKKMLVEFKNVENISYIHKDGKEYKFEQYPDCTIYFEDENNTKDSAEVKKITLDHGSILNIENQFADNTNGSKKKNKNKKIVDTKGLKKGDKVLYGKFASNDLMWTVVNNDNGKLELISDYSFNFSLDYRNKIYNDTYYLRSLFTKEEYDNIEVFKNDKNTFYKFYLLDEDKFNDVFKNDEDRKIYGCLGSTDIMGEKCYYVGKDGQYFASVNAVDEDGKYYPAYDIGNLPNRLCMQVAADKIYEIKKNEYEHIDFSYIDEIKANNFKNSYAGDVERVSATYIDNKIKERHLLNGFTHKLVRIGDEVKYVDYNHNIHDIKELSDYNNDYKIGDIIYFGNTRLNYSIENKEEKYISGQTIDENKKMVFRIMDIKEGVALLHSLFSISDNGNTVGEDGYYQSNLREYLNEDFYDNSFSEFEKNLIVGTDLTYYNGDKKFNDKIFTLENGSWHIYYQNMNTENFILSPKSLEHEYAYMQDLPESDLIDEDGKIKYMYYNKVKPVWFMSNRRSLTYGWSIISAKNEKDTAFLPMLRIKLYDEDISNVDDYYLPEFDYDNNIERAVLNGKDLYFMDSESNLYLIRDYYRESKVNKNQITKIGSNVGMLYKKDDDVFFFCDLTADLYKETEGVLYISNEKTDALLLSDSVFGRLFFDGDKVEFYVDGRLKGGEVSGKKYVFEYGVLTNSNGISKNIYNDEIIQNKDGILEDKEIIKDYKRIVVDRETKKFKIKKSDDKFNIIPYTKDDTLYICYNGKVIELDKIDDTGYGYYEIPRFYYIEKYDSYYALYSRKGTKNTVLKYLYKENNQIFFETLDEVNYQILMTDIYDGVFYYRRIPNNGWDPDISSCYSVERNENPKEIKYERFSGDYYYYNPKNMSEFYINNSGDLIENDKYGNRKIIEYYISDVKFLLNGVVYSKKIDEEFKVFYYDLKDKYEIGYGNALFKTSNKNYVIARDLKVTKAKDLFVFDKKLVESVNDNPKLQKEVFYKEVYDYLENLKEYYSIYNLYHVDQDKTKMIDDGVYTSFACGDEYLLYVKCDISNFSKNIDEIYELIKSLDSSCVNDAEKFVNKYLEYVKQNVKTELYLHGNGKKYKISFGSNDKVNIDYIVASEVKNNKLYIKLSNSDLYEIKINLDENLNVNLISDKVLYIIHNYDNGKLVFTKEFMDDPKTYNICSYDNGEIEVLINDIKIGDKYTMYDKYGKDMYKLFSNEIVDRVYGIKYTKGDKVYLVTIPEEEVLAEDIGDFCSLSVY